MQLDSYLELFTTFYGWAFANIFGEIVTGTGLVVIPFLVVILNAWREAGQRGMQDIGVMGVIKSVQTQLIVMLFVMSVCFFTSPITSLTYARLSYMPPPSIDNPNPVEATPGASGSTYDTALRDAIDGSMSQASGLSNVPLWWYSIMSISSGINNAFRNGMNNSGSDMRVLEDMAKNATIEDPALLGDVQRFYSECFIPARSQYLRSDRSRISATGASILAESNTDYGPTDVDWMGSQFFRTEPGYYASMRSRAPVTGFAIDYSRDTEYYDPSSDVDPQVTGAVNPEFGRPTCKQWWEDQLREKLIDGSPGVRAFASRAANVLTFTSFDKQKDEVARLASTAANPVFVDFDQMMGTPYDAATVAGRTITGAGSTLGVGGAAFMASMAWMPLVTSLPMIQALVLMGIYAFLPLATLVSGFSLRVLFLGAMAILTIKMWASMWYIATWIDGHLINAMYPGALGNIFVQEAMMIGKGAIPAGYKRMVLNTILLSLYVGLPVIWSSMMAWAGFRVAGGIDELMTRNGNSAAGSGKPPLLGRLFGGKK